MRAPLTPGSEPEFAMVPQREVDHWRKQGAVVAPEQTLGEFGYRATRSVNPMEIARGVSDVAMHPGATASGLANLPLDLAGQALGDFKRGNYLRAGRKALTAALPIAGGVGGAALGLAGGPAGAVAGGLAGYAAGSGVAAGLDEGVDQLEHGNVATGSGALVDATLQGALGSRAAAPRTAANAPAMSRAIDRRVQNTTARTFGPTVGPNRYGWGVEARKLGPEILKRTTSRSVEGVSLELEALRQRANAALDSAYDITPPGVKMKTDRIKLGLRDEIRALSTQDKAGRWVPLQGNAERVGALAQAYSELDNLPAALDAKTVRGLRQSWDKLAEHVWEPKTNAGWDKVRESGHGYAAARDVLNEQTMRVYPHLRPQAADASFSIKATDLLRQLEETENARSRVGRRTMATGFGAAIGQTAGAAAGLPTAGAALGAVLGPTLEFLVTEKVAPAVKIQAARTMAKLADDLRANKGRASASTMRLAQELRTLAQPVPAAGRGGQAVSARQLMQPLAADAEPPRGWFDTVRLDPR